MENKIKNKEPRYSFWAFLVYIPWINIFFIPYFSVKYVDSDLILFHSRQALVLFLFHVLSIFILFMPLFGKIIFSLIIIFHFFGVFGVLSKSKSKIPIISSLALKINKYFFYVQLTGNVPPDYVLEKELDESRNNVNLDTDKKNQNK